MSRSCSNYHRHTHWSLARTWTRLTMGVLGWVEYSIMITCCYSANKSRSSQTGVESSLEKYVVGCEKGFFNN